MTTHADTSIWRNHGGSIVGQVTCKLLSSRVVQMKVCGISYRNKKTPIRIDSNYPSLSKLCKNNRKKREILSCAKGPAFQRHSDFATTIVIVAAERHWLWISSSTQLLCIAGHRIFQHLSRVWRAMKQSAFDHVASHLQPSSPVGWGIYHRQNHDQPLDFTGRFRVATFNAQALYSLAPSICPGKHLVSCQTANFHPHCLAGLFVLKDHTLLRVLHLTISDPFEH